MANNRIYLRCKQCGETMFLGKCFGGEYYWRNYKNDGTHLEDDLNVFFEEHLFCEKPLNKELNDCETPYSDDCAWDTIFEIAYEIDGVTKQNYNGAYREEIQNYTKPITFSIPISEPPKNLFDYPVEKNNAKKID